MNKNTIIQNTADYIETHIEENLSLDQIAEALHYSKFYLARTFHKETNCTIYQYIRGRRLTIAAQKLVETKKPIIEIAYEAHYNSQQAFTFAFHNFYECAPQTYREKNFFYPKQPVLGISNRICAPITYCMLYHYYNESKGGRSAA